MSIGASDTKRAAILEEFAEACTTVARGLAPKGTPIDWETGKDGFVHFHCPLPGMKGPHTWSGAPRANAWIHGENVEAWCSKCVGDKKGYPDQTSYETARSAYTDQVKRAIRWEQDGVIHVGFQTTVLRSHVYIDRDFHHVIRRDKVRYEDGRRENGNSDPWRWRSADLQTNGKPGPYVPMRAQSWLAAHYPEHEHLYDALCWYTIDALVDWNTINGPPTAATVPLLPCRIVITEGEKDADTFNALMAAAGVSDLVATCLCYNKPAKLASHHLRLVTGREVIVVGDADDPGKDLAENWTSVLWDHASSIKLVREQLGLPGTPEAKDLTDWVVARVGVPSDGSDLKAWLAKSPATKATADELLNLFASTAPLLEPACRPNEWKSDFILVKTGGPKADSPHNAERVWTMHPLLRGKVRTNLHSGETEVVDPPWGGKLTVGSHNAAVMCAAWLEKTEKISILTRVFDEVVRQDQIAPVVNVVEQPRPWDGVPAIGRMVVDIPLDAPHDQALRLWETFFADLSPRSPVNVRLSSMCWGSPASVTLISHEHSWATVASSIAAA